MQLVKRGSVAAVTAAQMAEVDRRMVEEHGIALPMMMELAGRHLATLASAHLARERPSGPVVVLAGPGGNGGGALVAARRLVGWGRAVEVWLSRPERMDDVAEMQRGLLRTLGVPVHGDGVPRVEAGLVLDGLLGYGLEGAPRGREGVLVRWTATQGAPVLSLDVPSGLDATTGEAPGDAVRAAATLTLALPKAGLLARVAAPFVGRLLLADIGVPGRLLHEMGIAPVPPFGAADVLELE